MKHAWIARAAALALSALFLAGCGNEHAPWHSTNIDGAMPALEFQMMRVNDGKLVTGKDYRGKVVLLYFGYTHCPDVCPTTLSNINLILEDLGKRKASDIRVLFVTVDPNRDTPAILKSYVAAFAPQIDGLRGTPNQLAIMARRYRVAYNVILPHDDKPYTVYHSNGVFMFDRTGRVRLVTMNTDNTKGVASDLNRLLAE
jgi:protein SCO1/2